MSTTKQSQTWKEYKLLNKDRLKETSSLYYQKHKKQRKMYWKKYYSSHKKERNNYIREYQKTLRGKYCMYKASAKQRGIPFELTFEEFSTFVALPCRCCGSKLSNIRFNRVDKRKGYILSNLYPCCSTCFRLKRNLSEKMLPRAVKKISKHLHLEVKPLSYA